MWEHVYRISAITNGDIIPRRLKAVSTYHPDPRRNVGGCVDTSLIALSLEDRHHKDQGVVDLSALHFPTNKPAVEQTDSTPADCLQQGKTALVPFNNTAIYPPTAYLPQLLVFQIGHTFNWTGSRVFKGAEIAMLATYLTLIAASIVLIPRHRWVIAILGIRSVLPFSFMISADSLLVCLTVLFTCLFYRALVSDCSRGLCLVMVLLTMQIAVCKFTYIPFLGITLSLLVLDRFRRSAKGAILFLGALVGVLLWILWRSQLTWFVTNPSRVSEEVVATRMESLPASLGSITWHIMLSICQVQGGSSWEWPFLLVFYLAMLVGFIVIAYSCFRIIDASMRGRAQSKDPSVAETKVVALAYLLLVITEGFIYLAIWLQYTRSTETGVTGNSIRYLVPLLPLLVLILIDCLTLIRGTLVDYRSLCKGVGKDMLCRYDHFQ